MERWLLKISGLVQGVGFRPFLYNLAQRYRLTGWVRNNSAGVEIEIQGRAECLRQFVEEAKSNPPSAAKIEAIDCLTIPVKEMEEQFQIVPSETGGVSGSPLPDQGICSQCTAEFHNPDNRRFLHPFNSCTICGPRFTIIEDLPFDRFRTTMAGFELCPKCNAEYHEPSDRRFHAQTIACPECGPALRLTDSQGNQLTEDPGLGARRILKSGGILGVKGVGGYHLAADACCAAAVRKLRRLKDRDRRPFAVLFRDLAALQEYCQTAPEEEALLFSPVRPIVLLRQNQNRRLAGEVNPGLREVGAFLPYTGIQLLLFDQELQALVMTSGNRSGEPLTIDDDEAFRILGPMVDGFLIHDRKINWRCDDSVLRVQKGTIIGIRRSRGYVPAPLKMEREMPPLLACGAQQKNTFALTKGRQVFLSPHQGDLDNVATYLNYQETIGRFERLLDCKPLYAVHDLHPDYNSTIYARGLGLKNIGIQHHLAHLGSVIAERRLSGPVIGVAMDGSGYGTDGRIWGGEFFTGSECYWQRRAHLQYYPLPGGEAAVKEPWRMAAAYLEMSAPDLLGEWLRKYALEQKWHILRSAVKSGINVPETSSMGRLFDAVAALAGEFIRVSYEGEAAIWLEHQADHSCQEQYHFEIEVCDGIGQVDPGTIIQQVYRDLGRLNSGSISMKFHRTIAALIVNICKRLGKELGINQVALSGGVFQNRLLLDLTWDLLERHGFKVYVPKVIPINDAGIALGQAWLGSLMIERGIEDVFGRTR